MNSATFTSRLARFAPWLLAWLPALILLLLIEPLLVPVPFEDSWAFVRQYRDWCEGSYTWRDLMVPHNNHPCVPGKLIYFAVLHLTGGDVALLPWVAWLLTLGISFCVFTLARPLWKGRPWRGGLLMLCVNLILFSAAAGHAWTWDFIFLLYIPGACFVGGLVILSKRLLSVGRLAVAALLTLIGTFGIGSGFLGGVMLTAMVWSGTEDRSRGLRLLISVGWLLFTLTTAWIALQGFGNATDTGGEGSRVGFLLGQPLLLAQFILLMLGFALGNGTSVEPGVLCALMGAGVMALLVLAVVRLVLQRGNKPLLSAALPWLLVALYGLGNAGLIGYGRMRHSLISAMATRYVVFTLFFTLGVLLLLAALAAHEADNSWLRRILRRFAGVLLGFFIAAQAVNWHWGHQQMSRDHVRMRQEAALLGFSKVIPAEASDLWVLLAEKDAIPQLGAYLHDHDRLRGVHFLPSAQMDSLRKASEIASKWAWFDPPVLKDGVLHLQGVGGLSKDLVSFPDGIVISAQAEGGEERIVAAARSEIPFDFYENEWRRRLHLEHYFGWSHEVSVEHLPRGRQTLRAYAYDAGTKRFRPLSGTHVVDL